MGVAGSMCRPEADREWTGGDGMGKTDGIWVESGCREAFGGGMAAGKGVGRNRKGEVRVSFRRLSERCIFALSTLMMRGLLLVS